MNTRIDIIKKCIDFLEGEQKIIIHLSTKYKIDYKLESIEENHTNMGENQMRLENQLEEQYEEMDKLVTEDTLEQEYRKHILDRMFVMPVAMMIGLFLSIICVSAFGRFLTPQFSAQLLATISFAASSSISAISIKIHNYNCKKLFRKMGRLELPELLLEEQSYRMGNHKGKYDWLMEDIIKNELSLQEIFQFYERRCKIESNEPETRKQSQEKFDSLYQTRGTEVISKDKVVQFSKK